MATRRCGSCSLCCKLVPVRELAKGAGERCRHQSFAKGCAVYHGPQMPRSCALWSCRWLNGDDTTDLPRPDRAHYVIDVMPEFITLQHNETGHQTHVQVVQIWIDPDFPDAHRDRHLRAYMERRAREGIATLVRYSARDGLTIFAPPLFDDAQWHEVPGQTTTEHSAAEVLAVLNGIPGIG